MLRLAALLATLLVSISLIACDSGTASASNVVGTWKVDKDKTKAALEDGINSDKSLSEDKKKMALAFVAMILTKVDGASLTFNADKTCQSIMPGEPAKKGTWVLDAAGKTVTITQDGGGDKGELMLKGNELIGMESGKPAVVFKK